ncbi:MAG: FtsX-like permease family protein [Pseudomonadota bacterium]
MTGLPWGWLVIRLAWRQVRGGWRSMALILTCLAVGVWAVAFIQSLAAGMQEGLRRDGQMILGGDVSVRQIYQPLSTEQVSFLRDWGAVSTVIEFRASVRGTDDAFALAEVKAVDDAYPLYGTFGASAPLARLADGQVLVDPVILQQLGLAVGESLTLGDVRLPIAGVITAEPDLLAAANFPLGGRVLVHHSALRDTGLLTEGSLAYYLYRVRFNPSDAPLNAQVAAFEQAVSEAYPDNSWRLRSFERAAPRVQRGLERFAIFMTIIGLTSLTLGGLGIASGVRALVDSSIGAIAVLKCVGGTGRTIFWTYFAQVMILGVVGCGVGVGLGVACSYLTGALLGPFLPLPFVTGLYPGALATAAGYGMLTVAAFSLLPLARVQDVPAQALFRHLLTPPQGRIRMIPLVSTLAVTGVLVASVIIGAPDRDFAAWFVVGAVLSLLLFRALAGLVTRVARASSGGGFVRRLALSNIYRPGAPTVPVILSLGLGLSVLVAVSLLESNLRFNLTASLPTDAPTHILMDVPPDRLPALQDVLAADAARNIDTVPIIRGRIVSVNGVPTDQAVVSREHGWVTRSDRTVTFATTPPAEPLLQGRWWDDEETTPLVSVTMEVIETFAIGLGDRLTVNILGRDITAQIASIREVEWEDMNIAFVMIFNPAALAGAPYRYLVTFQAADAEGQLQSVLGRTVPGVAVIRIRDVIATALRIVGQLAAGARYVALVAVVTGILVLISALVVSGRQRYHDSVVLKVLGTSRSILTRAFLWEFSIVGLAAGFWAALVGSVAAYGLVRFMFDMTWQWDAQAALLALGVGLLVLLVFGMAFLLRTLRQPAAAALRNE